jgi:hypothetical protein
MLGISSVQATGYLRLQTAKTPALMSLPWQSRLLYPALLIAADSTGTIPLWEGHAISVLSAITGIPYAFVEEGLPDLLRGDSSWVYIEHGCLKIRGYEMMKPEIVQGDPEERSPSRVPSQPVTHSRPSKKDIAKTRVRDHRGRFTSSVSKDPIQTDGAIFDFVETDGQLWKICGNQGVKIKPSWFSDRSLAFSQRLKMGNPIQHKPAQVYVPNFERANSWSCEKQENVVPYFYHSTSLLSESKDVGRGADAYASEPLEACRLRSIKSDSFASHGDEASVATPPSHESPSPTLLHSQSEAMNKSTDVRNQDQQTSFLNLQDSSELTKSSQRKKQKAKGPSEEEYKTIFAEMNEARRRINPKATGLVDGEAHRKAIQTAWVNGATLETMKIVIWAQYSSVRESIREKPGNIKWLTFKTICRPDNFQFILDWGTMDDFVMGLVNRKSTKSPEPSLQTPPVNESPKEEGQTIDRSKAASIARDWLSSKFGGKEEGPEGQAQAQEATQTQSLVRNLIQRVAT